MEPPRCISAILEALMLQWKQGQPSVGTVSPSGQRWFSCSCRERCRSSGRWSVHRGQSDSERASQARTESHVSAGSHSSVRLAFLVSVSNLPLPGSLPCLIPSPIINTWFEAFCFLVKWGVFEGKCPLRVRSLYYILETPLLAHDH